jgi:hypothetical protein
MTQTLADQWREILAHLAKLRDAREPNNRAPRRHDKHQTSPVVRAYANAAQHRRQYKG